MLELCFRHSIAVPTFDFSFMVLALGKFTTDGENNNNNMPYG